MGTRKIIILILCLTGTFIMAGCSDKQEYARASKNVADSFPIKAEEVDDNPQFAKSEGPYVIIHTTAGDLTAILYPKVTPKSVENFIALAKSGYYEESLFDYVVQDTLVQGGKPVEGEEASSFGIPFEDEFADELHHFSGALAMANKGMNNNNSQFYIVTSQEIPEDEKLISANMYMNKLIREGQLNINQLNKENPLTKEEISTLQEELNTNIQAIGIKGVPEEFKQKYQKAVEVYMKKGGAYTLDYTHTVFGQIVKGLNVAGDMSNVLVDVERKPKVDMKIKSIEIVESIR